MVKTLLEVYGTPQKGDVLIYDDVRMCWVAVRKDEFLLPIRREMERHIEDEVEYRTGISGKLDSINSRISKLNRQLNTVAKAVGGK